MSLGEEPRSPRKILYVSWKTEGGSAFSLYHLVSALDGARYEPIVAFLSVQNPLVLERLRERGIEVLVLARKEKGAASLSGRGSRRRSVSGWLERHVGAWALDGYFAARSLWQFLRRDLGPSRRIRRAIRERGVDLVHANDGVPLSRAAIYAAWAERVPCLCHVRMFQPLTAFDRLLARLVARFIYISNAIGADCERKGLPAGRGEVVPNAVDLSEYAGPGGEEGAREEFGFGPAERLVGVVGRLDWWKGHEDFIDAMAAVIREIPEARGLIVGPFEQTPKGRAYGEALLERTRKLGLEGKIIFTGFRADVPRILKALDLLVLSSSEPEPFGRVLVEGMAAGKPVVATAAGGVLDIVEDGVNGLLVPLRDPNAMAAAIRRALLDRELAARLGKAGRKLVEERFTAERHARSMEAIYAAALASPKS